MQTRIRILSKLRETGFDSLTDDEIQYINYLAIMFEDREILCESGGIEYSGGRCRDCEEDEECFFMEVKKYIKK
jgi:hypothetical protein